MKMERVELYHQRVAVAPLMARAGTAAQNNPGKEAPSSGPHPVERLRGQAEGRAEASPSRHIQR